MFQKTSQVRCQYDEEKCHRIHYPKTLKGARINIYRKNPHANDTADEEKVEATIMDDSEWFHDPSYVAIQFEDPMQGAALVQDMGLQPIGDKESNQYQFPTSEICSFA